MTIQNIGKNLKVMVEGNEMVIRVRLDERHGLSNSAKTVLIGTSNGNKEIKNSGGVKVGLNIYVPVTHDEFMKLNTSDQERYLDTLPANDRAEFLAGLPEDVRQKFTRAVSA